MEIKKKKEIKNEIFRMYYLPSFDRLQSLRWILVKIKSWVNIFPNIEHCASGILNEDKFKTFVLLSSPETL